MPTVAPLDLPAHCLGVFWLRDIPHFALADGAVHRLDDGQKTVELHDGLLCVVQDGDSLLTGGEDGKVCLLGADGSAETLGELGRKWISSVAAGPQGIVAYASGRTVYVRFADGRVKELQHPRTAEALAFAPKGVRLGVARYNGVTLHFPGTEGQPTELTWEGAHTGITFSPDGKYLVTTMQENALHGWKLVDSKHMQMAGYPAKVKSMSWSAKGKWLATSGAPAAIVWPFHHKDGPMGKAPLELGTRGTILATNVCCHPSEDVVAIGFADGMILAARFADTQEVVLRRAGRSAITALGWDKAGKRLAFGSEDGACGIIDITG